MHSLMKPCPEFVNSRLWRAGIVLLALILVVFTPFIAEAKTDPLKNLKKIQLSYEVYLGGMHIMNSTATFMRNGPRYTMEMKAGTQGLLRSIAEWDADMTSTGRLEKEKVKPQRGTVVTKWQNEPKTVHFTFNGKKGVEVSFNPPENSNKHEPVSAALKAGALDPLSSIVQIMARFAYGQSCEQKVPVYDGHRRFDLLLKDSGTEKLEGEDYSVFSGEALRCEADFTMIAGSRKDREGSRFWEDEKGKKTRPPVYIYLGEVRPELPLLPVRAETSTILGNIMVHLKDITAAEIMADAKAKR